MTSVRQKSIILPCAIGDEVWIIRNYNGKPTPMRGKVFQMYFTDEMELTITVKGAARGKWGEQVFPTLEEASAAIEIKEG